jgi:hypothetical protein
MVRTTMCSIPVVSGLGRSGRVSLANDWLAERQAPTSNAPEASPALFSKSRRLILMTTLPYRKQIFEISDVIPQRPEAGRRTWPEG